MPMPVMTGVPALVPAPSNSSSQNRSPSPSRRTDGPSSTPSFEDEVFDLLFRSFATGQSGSPLISFGSFAEIVAIAAHGSLEDQFVLAHKVAQGSNPSNKDQLLRVLRVMYRLGYDGDSSYPRNHTKLKGFVGVIFDQLRPVGATNPLEYEAIFNFIIGGGLIEDFWTQLYC